MEAHEITRRFLDLHELIHPEGAAVHELRAEGVAASTILALYPFESQQWIGYLLSDLEMSGWNTVDVASGSIQNAWLDLESRLSAPDSVELDADLTAFRLSTQGRALMAIGRILNSSDTALEDVQIWAADVFCYTTFGALTIAANWERYPQLHAHEQHASTIIKMLNAIANAWYESMQVRMAIEEAHL
jgi:hypothetical protein